ncbi:MAG: hypothetical protein C0475_07220 [Planctomyces sp.]|nr:hypothetical protein [Planctomyces sp.]MBA4119706.1 hypothetical protein [Isosphaera sp.]
MLGRWLAGPRSRGAPGRGQTGRAGERLAEALLRRQGYRILARNSAARWGRLAGRRRAGEIDILALDPTHPAGPVLVVVEVKTRTVTPGVTPAARPEAQVRWRKARQLRRLLRLAVRRRRWAGPRRIDVIAVELHPDAPRLRHHIAAVRS